ncbi:hypothetical protein HDU96_005058 [Phlyctochytrium bullatum]|nr:hypothetical protein HDU96_005058 [Phlyctochytrium bullatum]
MRALRLLLLALSLLVVILAAPAVSTTAKTAVTSSTCVRGTKITVASRLFDLCELPTAVTWACRAYNCGVDFGKFFTINVQQDRTCIFFRLPSASVPTIEILYKRAGKSRVPSAPPLKLILPFFPVACIPVTK